MRSLRLVACLAIPAQIALGQQQKQQTFPTPVSTGAGLTLEQAISTARENNPLLQQTRNNIRTADAQVHSAYGALLPSLSANFSTQYTQSGTQFIQGVALPNPGDSYSTGYRVGVGYNISAAAAFAPRAAKANRAAAEATATSNSETLRANVTTQYIQVLEDQATAAVNDTLVQSAQAELDLANAKLKVGSGTILDVRTAEVALGQAEVDAATSKNQAMVDKVKLFQTMGVAPDTSAVLTTAFTLTAPPASLESLLDLARRVNPDVAAKKSNEHASQMQVRVAQSEYLPSLSLSTGIGGQGFGYSDADKFIATQQLNTAQRFGSCMRSDSLRVGAGLQPLGGCGSPTLSAADVETLRASNNPFKFQSSPFSLYASVSLPIFNGFQREQGIEQAEVVHDNAVFDLKSRQLQLVTDVTTAYLNLVNARKVVDLRETNARQATEALTLAEESYKVGAKTFVDVTTARGTYQKALVDRINAIYEYHKAFAALESAVGRPLR